MRAQANGKPPDGRRVVPVRLTDIDYETRMRAARRACRREVDDTVKVELILAAVRPSATVYWIAP